MKNPSLLMAQMQIGIDLGGTKIEGIGLEADTLLACRRRVATPRELCRHPRCDHGRRRRDRG